MKKKTDYINIIVVEIQIQMQIKEIEIEYRVCAVDNSDTYTHIYRRNRDRDRRIEKVEIESLWTVKLQRHHDSPSINCESSVKSFLR